MNKLDRTLQRMDCETYEELESVIQEMDDFVDAIVVEGIRDKEALEELGITKEIVMCSSRPDTEFVDYLSSRHKKVTILTDYDRAGKEINKKLSARLERAGIKVENQYRGRIGRILGLRGMRCIESVNSLKKRII
jgi:5S rRNA maturation endonuclease (ribonuclease M5)